jgi:hypothetical protein
VNASSFLDHISKVAPPPDCEAIRDRFEPLFALFSRCHSIFDQSEVHDLDNLGIK